ncbi:filamentous haemagglutinin family protein [Burkholderia sp. Ac-20353]|uniref:filamentous haemagglutinin family protein n=1 Tax=Burkholderia sp. Ac-20353 TaxID=2703894 RepID=UPI00197C1712|nr:filamentous haemagglutinin family protein [Burkholderia sp. Ac-20353]MBN3790718.1 filamentous hemagglutinin N-terminal domain-containing protein [Burkholderia sp. Ac-20353]
MLAAGVGAHAQAAGIMNLGQATSRASGGGAGGSGVPGVPNLGVSPQQALQASQPSIRNLGHAAQAVAAQIAAQQSAAAAVAGLPSTVPNGLVPGGLQVAAGITFVTDDKGNRVSQNTDATNPLLWVNANEPQQTVDSSGHVNVDVKQTGQNAVLTWETMNVGRQTTLNFDQSAGKQTNGANNWAVLNRINDPSGRPSQILGNVNAQGAVYVINRNGVLFGAGSQVNVHSLVASSLDLLNMNDYNQTFVNRLPVVVGNLVQDAAGIAASNQQFLSLPAGTTGGLAYPASGSSGTVQGVGGVPYELLGLGNQVGVSSLSQYQPPGDITIEPGASITTHINGTISDGGFVLVAAPNVTNGGHITATAGQVVMAAGVGVSLRPNVDNPQVLLPELSGKIMIPIDTYTSIDLTPAGTLTNTGIIEAARGNVNLLGSRVAQNGVVGVTTSVNAPGTITISTVDEYNANNPAGNAYLGRGLLTASDGSGVNDTNRAGLLSFGPTSVTAVLADQDGQTVTSSPGTTFTPGALKVTAGSVWFQGGSLVEAPGSTVSVAALSATTYAPSPDIQAVGGRIYVDNGATIDVSGLANVELPIADTLVTVGRVGLNELADSPLLRNGFLFGLKNVVVDSTLTGTRSDGVQWVGSPILNLSGYVNLIPRTVDQLLINGGTITLAGNDVMTAQGSSLNLNGGYIHYDGGMVNTTRLVDANGALVPIGQASPYDTYVGIAGQFTETHPRWGVTKTWYNPLLSGGMYQSDYIVGGNAGTLNVFASQALVLDGDISAQAFAGLKQVQGNTEPTGGTFSLGGNAQLTQGSTATTSGDQSLVILQPQAPQLDSVAPGFGATTPLDRNALNALPDTDPDNLLATHVVPVDTLNSGGFSKLNVIEDKMGGKGYVVTDGTQLKLQPGGSITLATGVLSKRPITVLGDLVVPSGTIALSTAGDIVVGADSLLSVAGQWVNNDTQAAAGTTPGGSHYVNGGSITLSAGGGVDLQAGSVLDVSSGGQMLSNGRLLSSNGIPVGKGGNVSLITDANPLSYLAPPSDVNLKMDGTIRSFGFAGGGALTLQTSGFQIGGDAASAPAWALALPADFFARQGFGSYVLKAMFDASVAPDTTVFVTQQNLIPNVPALQQAASGANLAAGGLTSIGAIDAYHRQPTSIALTGGNYLWAGPNYLNMTGLSAGPVPIYPDATGRVIVGHGASVITDPGGSIGLGSPLQVTVLGSLVAPGGAITLSADSYSNSPYSQSGQFQAGFTSAGKSVWLGSDAVLDVSGVALTNPLAAPVKNGQTTYVPVTGKVLPGGTVALSDDSGYVVAQAGSKIDVSGASANFDQLQANGTYASQPVWSDAGSIAMVASQGLFFDGTLDAHPGAAQANGGTLTILPHQNNSGIGATALVVRQGGMLVPAGLTPGQDFSTAIDPTTGLPIVTQGGVIQFVADRLNGSGIASLVLGDASVVGNPVPIAFAGDVDLTLAKSVIVNTGRIAAISSAQLNTLLSTVPSQSDPNSAPTPVLPTLLAQPQHAIGSTVTIDAPYVAFAGPPITGSSDPLRPVAAASDATLNVNAAFIDLENQFQLNNFGNANFTSRGDIRLSSTNPPLATNESLAPGKLYTPGNLTFKAADVYPSTGSTFIVDAVGPTDPVTGTPAPTTVTFASNGASGTPLSAGGTLLVDATNIVQGGTVRAPSGTLVFGVGDPTNVATQAQFDNLPLVVTDSVTLANGSVTSVSNGGLTLPYGTTLDGVEWQFNPSAANPRADLTAPPAKYVGVNGSRVALDKGATIDLSGGGDLQASEWVPGTGGTRDVLSQFNVSYATNASGVAVPVNAGGTAVYAIVPGAQSPVAAYDPVFAQTVQPAMNTNGTVGSQTLSAGVGQASLTSAVGQAVYLSGVPGLAAGYYTLLPGKYATLPGAYRVTVSSTPGNVAPGASKVLPDGTVIASGYFADALTGGRSATPTLFSVQSGAVWQQYAQYTLTSANRFFPALAAGKGNVTPPLPIDGGQLALAATKALALGATLGTAAGSGGAPAQVDIASQDIQITGNGAPALAGYLQIGADALDSLNAGSLLIGGTRAATTNGVTITPIANSVVVSNDGNTSLKGPEILLVTKTDASGTDPNAANGLRVDAGASIVATSDYPAAKDQPIAIAGDGALLRVSNGAMAALTRTGGTGTGLLTVGSGATLAGGQALTLDSSGDLTADPNAVLSAKSITADGSAITFTNANGAAAANLPGFVIDPAGLAQLANAQQVTLRSYGAIGFVGDVNATFGNSVDLSAGTFTSDGGHVTLNAPQIAFTNETGAPVGTATSGNGTLTVNAKEIDFGTGTKTLSGFANVSMTATGGIVGQKTGTFDFGALPVTLAAPVYLADTSSASTVKTTGTLTLNGAAGTALTKTPVGGAWNFIGGTLADNGATLAAPAGNVSLEATSGNLTIGSGATVSSAGVSKQFFDVTQYAPAGSITLTADAGTVDVQSGATLDFSGANGGGAAGSLTLSAPQQVVNLNGAIKGGAAAGFTGGSFSLDTGGAANLDSLATTLASSGVNSAIAVHTKTGNLTLSPGNTLTAHQVSLVADGGTGKQVDTTDGNVTILGTINASGVAGGTIQLYGKSGVDVEGTLSAIATTDGGKTINPWQRGGRVEIGTSAVFDPSFSDPVSGTAYNGTYGYESISAARTTPGSDGKYLATGAITIGPQAVIDVSGGTAGGLSGGTVSLRAPLLSNGEVPVSIGSGAQIKGSRATTLEAYAVWSTTDATTGAKHFDGVIDPAGWYDSAGNLGSGTFTDGNGNTVLNYTAGSLSADQLKPYLSADYFVPAAANTDHQTFYGYQNGDATAAVPGTLMGFVRDGLDAMQDPFAGTGIANARVVPGIELDNPSPAINAGNIQVLTNWNLGAGTSAADPAFRFHGQAPIVTLRAGNDVQVNASLTDGFFQIGNPLGGGTIAVPPLSSLSAAHAAYTTPSGTYAEFGYSIAYYGPTSLGGDAHHIAFGPGQPVGGTPEEIAEYYTLYTAYADYLGKTATSDITAPLGWQPNNSNIQIIFQFHFGGRPQAGAPVAPVAPSAAEQATNPASYLIYLNDYNKYLVATSQFYAKTLKEAYVPAVTPPAVQPVAVIAATTIPLPVQTDNTPAPVATAGNPLPLQSASLAGGDSSSFRVVSGADLTSVNPLALQARAVFNGNPNAGSVTLDGHTAFLDGNGMLLLAPTMIRTGTGSIDVAAGNNIALFGPTAKTDQVDPVVPGVIYTAGAPDPNAPAMGTTTLIVNAGGNSNLPDILVSPVVNPEAAGDIRLRAQGDISGIQYTTDTTGAVTGLTGSNTSQYWWQWMQITPFRTVSAGNTSSYVSLARTSIDFGEFDQGVMSVGGNVSVTAGGNIADLGVSLPTTWYLDNTGKVVTVGGGNLTVHAGGDILSGDYFVAKGTGTLTAGGQIAADFSVPPPYLGQQPLATSTVLAVQDGIFNVSARQGVDIGAVVNPSYTGGSASRYFEYLDAQPYSATSAVNVLSTTGDVQFGTLGGYLVGGSTDLPASLNLTAFTGGITVASGGMLFPSAVGQLNLIADQSVNLSSAAPDSSATFGMSDSDPATMRSPTQPFAVANAHGASVLHADDTSPVRIYSLNGSVTDGVLNATSDGGGGFYKNIVDVVVPKPALIQAGQDIVNLAFEAQNLREADITRVVAGRDIYDTPVAPNGNGAAPRLLLAGPGTFDIEAGRDIGPLTNQAQLYAALTSGYRATSTGIDAIGNADNPALPHESANINVLFGVGPGVDNAAFISAYIDPASTVPGVPSATPALIAFMEQYDAGKVVDTGLAKDKQAAQQNVGTLTAADAWKQFQALPTYVQQLFAEQVLFSVLSRVGLDYNDSASPYYQQYARGYQAINTLFPSALGYTANNLGGGTNGANKLVTTGNLDIRSTTIQTQQGGNITILGPGGRALVGSTSAPPAIVGSYGKVVAGPGTMGILTLEQGDVDIFTDQSVLLAQSRIFTEQGGNMTIWSSNGDINAGKGSKSVADTPAPNYVCDPNHYCTVDARGEVTGAGIATLQTIPGAPVSDANLIAPRGTVDAGDAGIRVSGNLNVAALHVANADNIQVQGKATGIPVVQAVNTGALTAASSAASAAGQMAQDLAKNSAARNQRRWTISVQVEGFGDGGAADQKKRRGSETLGYRPNASVAVLGLGGPGDTQRRFLTREEQSRLSGG